MEVKSNKKLIVYLAIMAAFSAILNLIIWPQYDQERALFDIVLMVSVVLMYLDVACLLFVLSNSLKPKRQKLSKFLFCFAIYVICLSVGVVVYTLVKVL